MVNRTVNDNSTGHTGGFGKVLRRLKAALSELTPVDTCNMDRVESYAVPSKGLLGWRCWTLTGKSKFKSDEPEKLLEDSHEEDVL